MSNRKPWLALLAAALAAGISGTATAQSEPVEVGFVGGLSGYLVHLDSAYRDGIKIAIEAAAADGQQFSLIEEDSRSDPSVAVTSLQKLIAQDDIDLLTGGCSSASTPAMAPLIAKAELVSMVCTTLAPVKSESQVAWLFNTSPNVLFDITTRYEYFKKQGWKKVAFLHDTTPYAKLQRGSAEELAPDFGLTLVAIEQYSPRDTDMSAQLTKLRAHDPDVVMQVGGGPAIGIIAKNMADLNFKAALAADFTVQPLEVYKVGGPATDGMIFPAMQPLIYDLIPASDPRKAAMAPFIEAWRAKYGDERDPSWAGLGYDGMTMLAMGLRKAGKTDARAVRAAMETIKDYRGASGIFGYAPDKHEGISAPPFTMVRMQDGQLQLLQ